MLKETRKVSRLEALFWSIALPGFGQLLNGKLIKGSLFIFLEFLINVKSHFNLGIMYSFLGDVKLAESSLDFQWLLFYPCMYMFAMWDAFKEGSGPSLGRFTYLPFFFGGAAVTLGILYFRALNLGVQMGPVFFPMLTLVPGLLIGLLFKMWLERTAA